MRAKVTIDLDAAEALIAANVPKVLDALGVHITRQFANYSTCLHGDELAAVHAEIGRRTASLFLGIDESAAAPVAAVPDLDACRHTNRLIRLDGTRKCNDCSVELARVAVAASPAVPTFPEPRRVRSRGVK